MAEMIEMLYGWLTWVGPGNPMYYMGSRSLEGKRRFLGLSARLTSIGSLCSGVRLSQSRCHLWGRLVGPCSVADGGQGRTNPFAAARGDNTAMRPFVKIL